MNAFEQIVSDVFQSDGYWTKNNYKLVLNSQEKQRIQRKSIPTIDIDIVAYKPGSILLIECKSYLGSSGVHYKDLFKNGNWASHYKMFTRKNGVKSSFYSLIPPHKEVSGNNGARPTNYTIGKTKY